MSHFSPIPPNERIYADNYRKELEPYEAQLVEVSGRCKEFRDHPERKDLQSLLLVNVQIRPKGVRKLIKLSHLWVLTKHVKRTGIEPKRGRRIKFVGSVYAYFRLGGKSKQRGLLGSHDFSILPMEAPDLQGFESGINKRYENKDGSSDTGATTDEERGSDEVGERKTRRSKHGNRRRRDHGTTKSGPTDGSGESVDGESTGSSNPRCPRKSRKTDSTRSTKNPQD